MLLGVYSEGSRGPLEAVLRPLGSLLGGTSGLPEASWGPLGGPGRFLDRLRRFGGASWGLLGASWGPLGASWAVGMPKRREGPNPSKTFVKLTILASRGALGGPLGGLLGRLGGLFGRLGALLGLSWGPLGPSWGHLGGLLGDLGAILGASWAVLSRRNAE